MHEDNEFDRYGRTLLWIFEHILHTTLLSLLSLSSDYARRDRAKKLSATVRFITGQLIMFISIYYAPLYLALGRPHIITVISLSYLLFHFFDNNKKTF
ncbi:hypothetical protein Ahy_A01g000916 isoform A [Arachis hypogaea]|uniref:Uncharacterized protein n=1 Tax=Arachis hypogaea TaxID=3818 RepID=A0A445ELQ0_ARAHY|nr:hypothetical protein Ahy_A01g000916 isoform A [Arachis hypogaea]